MKTKKKNVKIKILNSKKILELRILENKEPQK